MNGAIGKKDVEKAMLGSMISIGDELSDVYGLTEDCFMWGEHKKIFSAMYAVLADGNKLDLVILSNKLGELGYLSEVGGNQYLVELADGMYTRRPEEYAKILREEYKRICFMKISEKMMMYANSGDTINGETFAFAKEILDLNVMNGFEKYDVESSIRETEAYLEKYKGKELFGWSFGIPFLDKFTRGIQEGKTYRIGAPSNVGKTQTAYTIINSLLQQGARVAFFSLENDKEITLVKMLANRQGVNANYMTEGLVAPDFEYLRKVKDRFFLFDQSYELSDIFSKCMETKPDVVILDYIGLVNIKKVKEDDKYTEYAKQVQQFVKRERYSWIDLSNLPKGEEDEEQLRMRGGFYGSSFLKNNADVGIHIFYNRKFYKTKDELGPSMNDQQKIWYHNKQGLTFLVSKNRLGPAKVEEDFVIDFEKGGRFLTPEEDLQGMATSIF